MATILSVDAAHDDGEFPPLTSEQGDRIAALLRTPGDRAGDLATDRIRPVVGSVSPSSRALRGQQD
jgi:hypothetical protein